MNRELSAKIDRLPLWAQAYIANLQLERDAAIKTLNEFTDSQTESDFWCEKNTSTGEEQGPSTKRFYIQSHAVSVRFKGYVFTLRLRSWEREPRLQLCCEGADEATIKRYQRKHGGLIILPEVTNVVGVDCI